MLVFKKKHLVEIIDHALRDYPLEACGIAAGKDDVVEEVYPLTNQDKSSVTYFASPEEQLKAFKDMRRKGYELLAIYHSHPASEAFPSPTDVERAFYPEAAYVIVSLRDISKPEVRAFKILNGEIEEIPINVTGDEHVYKNIR